MLIGMSDIRAVDSGDTDTTLLLVVLHPLAKVLMGFLRIAVIAATKAERFPVSLLELQGYVEVVGSDVLAQDKTVAIIE